VPSAVELQTQTGDEQAAQLLAARTAIRRPARPLDPDAARIEQEARYRLGHEDIRRAGQNGAHTS
jgi:hypothetical protein